MRHPLKDLPRGTVGRVACPAKIRVKFESKPNMTEYHVTGDLFQYEVERTNPSKFYPTDFAMSPNPSAVEDSILSAKMLAGAVRHEFEGFKARGASCVSPQ